MAQKRIKSVRDDILGNKLRLLYDDETQGEIDLSKAKGEAPVSLIGLTLKQAKMVLGIKK